MGTRGAVCLVADDAEKVIYNHFDSYPDGLGNAVLAWLQKELSTGDESALRRQAASLRPVPDTEPTDDDFTRLAEFHDPNVSSGRDWYSLLRGTQGDLSAMLRAGLYEDAADFPRDSLFCEWAYVVDFDGRAFEVYEGFRTTPPTDGRWAEQPGTDERGQYFPVQRVARWSFDELPLNLDGMLDDA